MNVQAATPRMPVATIDLCDQLSAIRQIHSGHRTDRWRAVCVEQPQAKEATGIWRFISKKVRRSPLVGADKIEPTIAIHVGNSDASADHWFCQAKLRTDVVVSSIWAADEEWIAFVPT